ncbi:MAG: FAD-binding protein [Nitrospirota bacterium]|jgi:succinate dehydrogenase / fumarate reductase flavoprotein subunit
MYKFDAIIIGSGLAGLRAAYELVSNKINTAIISKVYPLRSHSIAAQGGVNAALANNENAKDDSWEKHACDTIKGSDYLGDQDAILKMCKEGPQRIFELEHWGCPFSRTDDGRISQRPFGGQGFPRTAYAADRTGHAMLHTLYEQIIRINEENKCLTFFNEWLVTRLIVNDKTITGIIALDLKTGNLELFKADAVIIATGGAGRLYGKSTNALINTGIGLSIAYHAGADLKDMEFIQFHPTTLFTTNILITEGARGEGGYLLNSAGERFLANYEDSKKAMEIAPRDIVSRNMIREIKKGNAINGQYLHLDLRHLGKNLIMERLPGVVELAGKFAGINAITEPIPVEPGQHYTMGGIDTDMDTKTKINGLYAAGEAACVSVHGANRLGGNSLLETVVFGAAAGEMAGKYIKTNSKSQISNLECDEALREEEKRISRLFEGEGRENAFNLFEELNRIMWENFGIFKEDAQMKAGQKEFKNIKERSRDLRLRYKGKRFNFELYWLLEFLGSINIAEAIIAGAIERAESRGSHYRTDYPKRDDENWLKHTIASYSQEGPKLSYKPVALGYVAPAERKY